MSGIKALKAFIAGVVSFSVIGCAGSNTINNPMIDPSIQLNNIGVQANAVTSSPVFAMFNNAYKGLYEENEAIGRKDPKNPDKYFFKLIASARKTLDICFFDIDDPGAVAAFIKAKKKGVDVRIVTDSDNFMDKDNDQLPRKAIEDLKAAGIPIVGDNRSAFMHHKFMIVDKASVWVSSMNPTTTSMYHHNNNSVLINSPAIAENYQLEFNRLFIEKKFGPRPYPAPNQNVRVGDAVISTYFSPKGGVKDAIMAELKKAKVSIKFMAFSFTEDDMSDIMIDKFKQGLKVEGIFDQCLLSRYAEYKKLKENNVYVRWDGNQALLHHKTIIIDNETVITGSYNFSASAETSNNEDVVIIKSPKTAYYYNQEYGNVKYASLHNLNLPDYDHPACKH